MIEMVALFFQLAILGVIVIPLVYLFRLVIKALKIYINKNSD